MHLRFQKKTKNYTVHQLQREAAKKTISSVAGPLKKNNFFLRIPKVCPLSLICT